MAYIIRISWQTFLTELSTSNRPLEVKSKDAAIFLSVMLKGNLPDCDLRSEACRLRSGDAHCEQELARTDEEEVRRRKKTRRRQGTLLKSNNPHLQARNKTKQCHDNQQLLMDYYLDTDVWIRLRPPNHQHVSKSQLEKLMCLWPKDSEVFHPTLPRCSFPVAPCRRRWSFMPRLWHLKTRDNMARKEEKHQNQEFTSHRQIEVQKQ